MVNELIIKTLKEFDIIWKNIHFSFLNYKERPKIAKDMEGIGRFKGIYVWCLKSVLEENVTRNKEEEQKLLDKVSHEFDLVLGRK